MKKLLLTLFMLASGICYASYPSGGITITTPLPVGSGPDTVVRMIANILADKYKQPVTLQNRPGGNGIIALNAYLNSTTNDGLNLLFLGSDHVVVNPILYNTTKYNDAIVPVAAGWTSDLVLIADSKTLTHVDLAKTTRANPMFGSWGIGSPSQLMALQYLDSLGIEKSQHVVYKDYNQWFIDVSRREMPFSFATLGSSLPFRQNGNINWILTTGNKRLTAHPSIPTFFEVTGKHPKMNNTWGAFYVNKEVPIEIQQQITKDIQQAFAHPDVRNRLKILYYDYWDASPAEITSTVTEQTKNFRQFIKQYSIKIE